MLCCNIHCNLCMIFKMILWIFYGFSQLTKSLKILVANTSYCSIYQQVHLCETDGSLLSLALSSTKSNDVNDKSSPTSQSFYNKDSFDQGNDRIMRKTSTSSSSGSSKSSQTFKGQNRGITFSNLKDSEQSHPRDDETVVVVVRSLWRDVSQDER